MAKLTVPARLPFYVYGTLRPGFGFANYEQTLRDTTTDGGVATLTDASLWHLSGFPGVYLRGNTVALRSASAARFDFTGSVIGSLLYVRAEGDDEYRDVLARADRLENFFGEDHPNNMYRRIAVDTVLASSGEVIKAWLYEALIDPHPIHTARPVPDGDWPAFVQAQQIRVAGEEWSTDF